MNSVPAGWSQPSLRDVCLPVSKVDPVGLGRTEFQYVDIGSIESGAMRVSSPQLLAVVDAPSRARQLLARGDTVFSTVRPYLKKIAWVNSELDGEIASTGFCVLRPKVDVVHPRFLFHFATSDGLLDQVLPLQRGVSYPAVRDGDVLAARIPLPPLDEQRRIVNILEDHLSRLDTGMRGLDSALAKSAHLLGAMRQEAVGLTSVDTPLADVASIQGGIQKQPKRRPQLNAAPFLRVANVTSFGLDLADIHEIELFAGEIDRYRLEEGDLLVVEGNGSPSQIGRAALWGGEIQNCVHQNHLIRVRPSSRLNPKFLEIIWNAPSTRRRLTAVSSSTSGLHTLSVAKLKAMPICVPDLDKQDRFVHGFEIEVASIDRLTTSVAACRNLGSALRRSLMVAAFAGALTNDGMELARV